MFVPGKPLQPSLMFAGKAGAYQSEAPFSIGPRGEKMAKSIVSCKPVSVAQWYNTCLIITSGLSGLSRDLVASTERENMAV